MNDKYKKIAEGKRVWILIFPWIFKENHHAPTSMCVAINKSLLGAFGIPELRPPIRRWIFKENHHVPTSGCTAINKSLLGAFGIPEFRPPIRRWIFKEN